MKLAALITARMGSKRLPRKHLQEAGGRPILKTLTDRIQEEFEPEIKTGEMRVFISTADEPANREFERSFPEVEVFYGSPTNIPYRHLQNLRKHGLDAAISVDGDDILCSPSAMRLVMEGLKAGHDLVSTKGLPLGMNACGYTAGMIELSLAEQNPAVLETGWGRIFRARNPAEITLPRLSGNELLRFTLDYPQDLAFFRVVLDAMGSLCVSDEEIVRLVEQRQFGKLNEDVSREYWANFHEQVRLEKARESEKPRR